MACITFEVPVATKNPTNQRDQTMARHRRAKGQCDATACWGPGEMARCCWWCASPAWRPAGWTPTTTGLQP